MIADIYVKKFEEVGFEMVNAKTGKEVLRLANEDHFDLILLDMVLPEMNGMDVLKELRGGDYDKELKIIVWSNLSKMENEIKVLEKGADGFISKSQFNPSQLADEVNRLLEMFERQKLNKEKSAHQEVKNRKKKILFIEDEDIFLEMFGKSLESEGYQVEYAQNGVVGNRMATENQYDLIITDIVMPAMPGDEIIRRLKLDDKTKDIPVIVLTASLDDDDMQPVRDMGIADFFEKTHVVPGDLARRVTEILN